MRGSKLTKKDNRYLNSFGKSFEARLNKTLEQQRKYTPHFKEEWVLANLMKKEI